MREVVAYAANRGSRVPGLDRPGLFSDAYLHIGGDENTGKHWAAAPAIQACMAAHHLGDTLALQGDFAGRLRALARPHGRSIVG